MGGTEQNIPLIRYKLPYSFNVVTILPRAPTLSRASASGTVMEGRFPDFMPRTVFKTEDADVKERENVEPAQGKPRSNSVDSNGRTEHNEMQLWNSVGYAVAIYPYIAEQGDEFDVEV